MQKTKNGMIIMNSLDGFRHGLFEYDEKQVFMSDKLATGDISCKYMSKHINAGSRLEMLIKKHDKFKANHNEITKDKTIRNEIALLTSQFDISYLDEKIFLYYKDNEKSFHYVNNKLIVCYIIRRFLRSQHILANDILAFAKLNVGNLIRLHKMELVDVL